MQQVFFSSLLHLDLIDHAVHGKFYTGKNSAAPIVGGNAPSNRPRAATDSSLISHRLPRCWQPVYIWHGRPRRRSANQDKSMSHCRSLLSNRARQRTVRSVVVLKHSAATTMAAYRRVQAIVQECRGAAVDVDHVLAEHRTAANAGTASTVHAHREGQEGQPGAPCLVPNTIRPWNMSRMKAAFLGRPSVSLTGLSLPLHFRPHLRLR